MADRYCKYCEREKDDCHQRCAGWTDTAALRNQLQVQVIELGELRDEVARARTWIGGDRGVTRPTLRLRGDDGHFREVPVFREDPTHKEVVRMAAASNGR